MRTKALTVTELEKINQTSADRAKRVADILTRAAIVAADGQKEQRLKVRQCSGCFYTRGYRLAGQAFTNWKCSLCGKEDSYPNTGVPRVCNDCADSFDLCVECGGDINMNHKTRYDRKANKK